MNFERKQRRLFAKPKEKAKEFRYNGADFVAQPLTPTVVADPVAEIIVGGRVRLAGRNYLVVDLNANLDTGRLELSFIPEDADGRARNQPRDNIFPRVATRYPDFFGDW